MSGDEPDLVRSFIDGARAGTAGGLLIEGDALLLDGWWQAAFRLADDAFLVRAEAPPVPTDLVDRLTGALHAAGLEEIPGEHKLVHAVTYAELSVVGVHWTLWAPDAPRGTAALGARAAPESMPQEWAPSVSDDPALGDLSAEFARSLVDGMPVSVVLAVGLDDETVAGLVAAAPGCRVESRRLEEAVTACGRLVPHLVVVDASGDEGRRFLLEFRAEACGRHVPVAAVTEGDVPPGADTTLDPRRSPSSWREQLVRLLP